MLSSLSLPAAESMAAIGSSHSLPLEANVRRPVQLEAAMMRLMYFERVVLGRQMGFVISLWREAG